MTLNVGGSETIDSELLSQFDRIGSIWHFASGLSGAKVKPEAGVTHGSTRRLGVCWGTPGCVSGSGAILKATADEKR